MISQEIKCSGCGATIEVNVWKKFVICPFCEAKTDFEGFKYKKIGPKSSMYSSMKYEQDCPACRSKHMLTSSILGKWRCVDCGYQISSLHKITGIFWFCDNCETYMNIQPNFTTKKKKWKCTECGYNNSVTRKDVW